MRWGLHPPSVSAQILDDTLLVVEHEQPLIRCEAFWLSKAIARDDFAVIGAHFCRVWCKDMDNQVISLDKTDEEREKDIE